MHINEFCEKTRIGRSDLVEAFKCPKSTVCYYANNGGHIAFAEGMWHLTNKSNEITFSCHTKDLPGPHRVL